MLTTTNCHSDDDKLPEDRGCSVSQIVDVKPDVVSLFLPSRRWILASFHITSDTPTTRRYPKAENTRQHSLFSPSHRWILPPISQVTLIEKIRKYCGKLDAFFQPPKEQLSRQWWLEVFSYYYYSNAKLWSGASSCHKICCQLVIALDVACTCLYGRIFKTPKTKIVRKFGLLAHPWMEMGK